MKRSEVTELLGRILIEQRFSGMGKYWASEVSIDYGTTDVKRVDFMQFVPSGSILVSDIEKGTFICYEVKSCKADFNSGFGKNFIAEKNYFVMPMSVYKELRLEIPHDIGVLVPIPVNADKYDEFDNPSEFCGNSRDWKLYNIKNALPRGRKKSMVELLFCMIRSGKSYMDEQKADVKLQRIKELELKEKQWYETEKDYRDEIKELKSNPPLKFDELKEGMPIWDSVEKCWIYIVHIARDYNNNSFTYVWWFDKNDDYYTEPLVEFEENRFYRREVKNE